MCGFLSNGPLAALGVATSETATPEAKGATVVHGSSTAFLLLGPQSNRPVGHSLDLFADSEKQKSSKEGENGENAEDVSEKEAEAFESVK